MFIFLPPGCSAPRPHRIKLHAHKMFWKLAVIFHVLTTLTSSHTETFLDKSKAQRGDQVSRPYLWFENFIPTDLEFLYFDWKHGQILSKYLHLHLHDIYMSIEIFLIFVRLSKQQCTILWSPLKLDFHSSHNSYIWIVNTTQWRCCVRTVRNAKCSQHAMCVWQWQCMISAGPRDGHQTGIRGK